MPDWHIGHEGAVSTFAGAAADFGAALPTGVGRGADADASALWIMPCSSGPSINVMLRPVANAIASAVKVPDVTTKPPAAPLAAMTP